MTSTTTDDRIRATLNASTCHTVPWCGVQPGRHQHDHADSAILHRLDLGKSVRVIQYETADALETPFVEVDRGALEMRDPADAEHIAENLTIAAGILRAALTH